MKFFTSVYKLLVISPSWKSSKPLWWQTVPYHPDRHPYNPYEQIAEIKSLFFEESRKRSVDPYLQSSPTKRHFVFANTPIARRTPLVFRSTSSPIHSPHKYQTTQIAPISVKHLDIKSQKLSQLRVFSNPPTEIRLLIWEALFSRFKKTSAPSRV